MLKITIRERTLVSPFNEPARDPRVPNKPLWLHQRDILAPYRKPEREAGSFAQPPGFKGEAPVYRDDPFFDRGLLEPFLKEAHKAGGACRGAFRPNDKAIVIHALPLQDRIRREGNVYIADRRPFPAGPSDDLKPAVQVGGGRPAWATGWPGHESCGTHC
jgi:hypothetical protein